MTVHNNALAQQEWMYISSGGDRTIYRCLLNNETGEMTELTAEQTGFQPQFLINHPTLNVIYSGAKTDDKANPVLIKGFIVDPVSGKLSLLGDATVRDNGSTHIAISDRGTTLLSCSYGGDGTISVGVNESGKFIEDSGSKIEHSGTSAHERQKRHHPHGIAIHADGKFACVADLGNDHIEIYSIDEQSQIAKHSRWKAADGAGPRHVTFHPNQRWLYSINEINGTIDVLGFDSESGEMEHLQTVPTLPEDFDGENTTAEIVVHPSGKFVYGSNRGHDSIAVYQVDTETGQLKFVEHESTQGDHPRFVGLNAAGNLFIATNMHSDNMVSFYVDMETGALKPTGHTIEVGSPRGAVFVPKQ